jgi:hypothetical protein
MLHSSVGNANAGIGARDDVLQIGSDIAVQYGVCLGRGTGFVYQVPPLR